MKAGDFLLAATRVVLGGVFVYAALTKIGSFHTFAEETANYQLLPAFLVAPVAVTLVGVELVSGVLLITGLAARAAAAVIGAMTLVFIAGLSQALVRGIDLRCGCFGGADEATWWTVARDIPMLVAAVALVRFGPGRPSLGADDAEA